MSLDASTNQLRAFDGGGTVDAAQPTAAPQLEVVRLPSDLETLRTVIQHAVTRALTLKMRMYSHFDHAELLEMGSAIVAEQKRIQEQLLKCLALYEKSDVVKVADRAFSAAVTRFPSSDLPFTSLYNQFIWSVIENTAPKTTPASHVELPETQVA